MRVFWVTLILSLLTACSVPKPVHYAIPGDDNSAAGGSGGFGDVALVPADNAWTPEKSEVVCKDKPCPSQVGLLIFVFPAKKGQHKIVRCTGFLVGKDRVMSNGHCDYDDQAAGYFILAQDVPVTEKTHFIKKRLTKIFTKNRDNPKIDSGRPDVAVFELATPVDGVLPLQLAAPNDPTYSELDAFVVNTIALDRYEIKKIHCDVRRHGAYFPYDVSQNPDVLFAFGCSVRHGNSGAPMFAPGQDKVQAIVQGSGIESGDQRVYDKRKSIAATNLRCLNHKDKCTTADVEAAQLSFQTEQRNAVDALMSRPLSKDQSGDFDYQPAGYYQLASPDQNELKFEVVYIPLCRKLPEAPTHVRLVSELVRLRFDEWANISNESGGFGFTDGEIGARSGDQFQARVNWFSGFGTLVHPEEHPRAVWGPVFSIDLPKCSR